MARPDPVRTWCWREGGLLKFGRLRNVNRARSHAEKISPLTKGVNQVNKAGITALVPALVSIVVSIVVSTQVASKTAATVMHPSRRIVTHPEQNSLPPVLASEAGKTVSVTELSRINGLQPRLPVRTVVRTIGTHPSALDQFPRIGTGSDCGDSATLWPGRHHVESYTLCRNQHPVPGMAVCAETVDLVRLRPAEPKQTDPSHWDQTVSLSALQPPPHGEDGPELDHARRSGRSAENSADVGRPGGQTDSAPAGGSPI